MPTEKTATTETFRAGDIVSHEPTGETWVLAVDEEDGKVMPNGWPETLARASDCGLIEAASDETRQSYLKAWASKKKGGDLRITKARRQRMKDEGITEQDIAETRPERP